ncbi:glycosyltransferase, partial [bacterium]|nr:glycosyltransferase [bacterium]
MASLRTLVVLPCYNEAGTAPGLVTRLRGQGVDVLVVDDDSPDHTADIVAEAFAGDAG